MDLAQRVRQLEQELNVANEVARRLQEEADVGKTKKKPPMLGNIGKSASAEGVSLLRINIYYKFNITHVSLS